MTVGIIALVVVWAGVQRLHTRDPVPETPAMIPLPPPAVAPPAPVEERQPSQPSQPSLDATVLHQEIPDISTHARESIHGVIKIAVHVIVDRSGNVVTATLENRGSSKYFDRAATKAAKRWKFVRAADHASREWLLHFDFTQDGVTAEAAALH
jgi:TonB family protein